MKKIDISTPKYPNTFAIVDDEDFDWLNQWKWRLDSNGYADRMEHIRLGKNCYKSKRISMHRLINNTPDGFDTDHVNRNKLDNRRENLRSLSRSLNNFNSGLRKNNSSGYTGVSWSSVAKKWMSEIKVDGKHIYLGIFSKIKDAVNARLEAERIYVNHK